MSLRFWSWCSEGNVAHISYKGSIRRRHSQIDDTAESPLRSGDAVCAWNVVQHQKLTSCGMPADSGGQ